MTWCMDNLLFKLIGPKYPYAVLSALEQDETEVILLLQIRLGLFIG